ncbi:GntR family transcriptional regulator [Streptomyces sp. XY533]|uniref:GntR family transcriptional regulator n=1 Tax=Streptomyces sp. XY533 TaxID=1519481 RepID=UPI0006B0697E|nr:GntR family transcriptional regulator [Streptomyces sp. XY533]
MSREGGAPPKYRQIADDLRGRITDGEFSETGKLPPERELIKQYYGVSKAQGTVRQALGVLRDEGLIESRVGSGVYVRAWRPIVRHGLERLMADQWGSGKSIWDVDVEGRLLEPDDVQIQNLPAPEDVARALDLEPGDPIYSRNRRYLVDRVPVLRSTSYVPEDLARGTRITEIDTGPGGVYARLADAGHKPVRFREDLRCRMPSVVEAGDLDLSAATPVVELVRHAYDSTGRVVEVNRMVLDASRYVFRYEFTS